MTAQRTAGIVIVLVIVAAMAYWLTRRAPRPAPAPEPLSPDEQTALLEKLRPVKANAWVPVTSAGDGERTASKFSGIPWLAEGEAWPVCPRCSKPRQLFLQLNLASLPEVPQGCPKQGLLQFFYCTNDETECEIENEGWAPFSRNSLIRIVEPTGPAAVVQASPVKDAFPPKLIINWERKDDYPGWGGELADHGISVTDAEFDWMSDAGWQLTGEKLMGWPFWVQDVEYPDCPDCGQRMHLLFQIDSDGHLPYMFGDSGCGHITQCPKHPSRLAFAWACM